MLTATDILGQPTNQSKAKKNAPISRLKTTVSCSLARSFFLHFHFLSFHLAARPSASVGSVPSNNNDDGAAASARNREGGN